MARPVGNNLCITPEVGSEDMDPDVSTRMIILSSSRWSLHVRKLCSVEPSGERGHSCGQPSALPSGAHDLLGKRENTQRVT